MSGSDLLTLPEIADHLGVSRWTVGRLIGTAGLEATTSVDGNTRVTRSAYMAFLNRQAMTPSKEVRNMPQSLPGLPDLHLFEDVAAKYQLSLRGLKDGARARKFEHIQIGKLRYFTDEQLGKFFAAHKVGRAEDKALAAMRDRRARRRPRQNARSAAA